MATHNITEKQFIEAWKSSKSTSQAAKELGIKTRALTGAWATLRSNRKLPYGLRFWAIGSQGVRENESPRTKPITVGCPDELLSRLVFTHGSDEDQRVYIAGWKDERSNHKNFVGKLIGRPDLFDVQHIQARSSSRVR